MLRSVIRRSVIALLVLPVSLALADGPPPPADHAILGLYTAPQFGPQTKNWIEAQPGETVTIHAVLSYSMFNGLGGVEFTIATDPPGAFGTSLMLGDVALDDLAVMVTMAPDYVIGYHLPVLPIYSQHRVLSQDITVLSSSPVLLSLQPYANPTLPQVMAYNNWFDASDVRPMIPNSAGHDHGQPVFGVNTQIVAAERATWGGVKALFD